MVPKIEYKASVEKDLRKLDRKTALTLLGRIERALRASRDHEALGGEFSGLFGLRLGDHRVIYTRTHSGYLVLRIGHRRDIYQKGRPR